MTEHLADRKYRVIEKIVQIEDEALLSAIEQKIDLVKEEVDDVELWGKIIQPTKKSYSLEELVKEQAYVPIAFDEWKELTKALAIEEDIFDLLDQL